MSARTIRWAFIGASTIARQYMVRAVGSQPDGVLRGIYSTSEDRRRMFVERLGFSRAYESLDECLQDKAVDAVYVSTTNELHAPQVIAAAQSGKHVLCEKPLATSEDAAEEMVRACERAGVVFATNHHLPNAATHRVVRSLIQGGDLGELRAVRMFHARWLPEDLQTWRTGRAESGAGVILDVTVHDAALMRFLLGERIRSVMAEAFAQHLGTGGIEDAVMGVMVSESGIPISFHDAWTVAHAGTGLEVHGSQASVIGQGVMTSDPVGDLFLRRGDDTEELPLPDREDLYVRAVRRFHEAVRGTGHVAVSGRDGLDSLRVAIAVAESARSGSRVMV